MNKRNTPRNKIKIKAPSESQVIQLKLKSHIYLNREMSWLNFNRRVLAQAADAGHPLLERLRFCNIFIGNLNEFCMKRIGGLKNQIESVYSFQSIDGKNPREQLKLIREEIQKQMEELAHLFEKVLRPLLVKEGIHLVDVASLAPVEKCQVDEYFRKYLFPVLTPHAVDPGHPFPFISNLSKSYAIRLKHPNKEEQLFARVKIPSEIPQWYELKTAGGEPIQRFVSIDDIIRQNLHLLFHGLTIEDHCLFKVTRNADLAQDDEDAEDLLEFIESELKERQFAPVLRLELDRNASEWIRKYLQEELEIDSDDIYEIPSLVCHTPFSFITGLERPDLKFPVWKPVVPHDWQDEELNIFSLIRKRDHLVHHPYESFQGTVERLVREAARDPKVVAIKMTLYRIGERSAIIDSLLRAAESGKQVAVLIELKARFDEKNNIRLAQKMEKTGIHVAYGMVGLKTHSKMCLIVRDDFDGPNCYVHIGTGNYNAQTANVYTDLSLITCDRRITNEVIEVFNYLTGISLRSQYEHLLVAPVNMRKRMAELIRREVEHHKQGRPALIRAKMNSLEDLEIIDELNTASLAGIHVELMVRGFCTLRPGMAGVNPNTTVRSTVGRFLEHSRIYHFRNGQADPLDGDFYIGSSDIMYRSLNNRIEVITPVFDRELRSKLWNILELTWNDHGSSWQLKEDGHYVRQHPEGQKLHNILMKETKP